MTPWERYQRDLTERGFSADPAQQKAVARLQALYEELVDAQGRQSGVAERLRRRIPGYRREPVRGIYLWGGVGRGKTWLVDAFYNCLPFERKQRVHFHRFMRGVHQSLKSLDQVQDPLRIVADRFAERVMVICFDEFHVSDITDAMLLGGLFKALFERGITLVATSNDSPDELYKEGLQRERFLPAIAQLKEHTHVLELDGDQDYRMRYLEQAQTWHWPLDENADRKLAEVFEHVAPDAGEPGTSLQVEGRPIRTVKSADGVVWFDFSVICEGPRGPADYIEIARQYQCVLVGKVPVMDDSNNDAATRFITLVDEFYDRNVRLIVSADAEPYGLYRGKRLAKPFRRTVSRLVEMQSGAYLARRHQLD